MKTKILLIIILALTGLSIRAQTAYQKILTDTADYGYGVSLMPTSDSGYILLANILDATFPNRPSQVIRFNSKGDTLWSKYYGSLFTLIRPTFDGGFILGDSWGGDSAVVKADANGNIIWAKTLNGYTRQTMDSGYIVVSPSYSFLLKTKSNGDTMWTKQYTHHYANQFAGFVPHTAEQTSDKGFLMAGNVTDSITNGERPGLIKTDSLGNVQWSKCYDGLGGGHGGFQTLDSSGYIFYGGYGGDWQDTSLFLIKTNSTGNVLWNKQYTPNGSGFGAASCRPTLDGGYILMSHNFAATGGGPSNIYLIKTNKTGDTLWTRKYGMPANWSTVESYSGVEQTLDKGFIVTGFTADTSTGVFQKYLIKTNSSGFSGGCYEYATNISVSSISLIATPITVITQPTGLVYSSTSINATPNPITIATLCSSPTSDQTIANDKHSLSVYPNPFSNQTTLQTAERLQNASLTISNSVGQTVKRIDNLSGSTVLLHRDNLPSGLYFVRLTQDGNTISADKLVITDR